MSIYEFKMLSDEHFGLVKLEKVKTENIQINIIVKLCIPSSLCSETNVLVKENV